MGPLKRALGERLASDSFERALDYSFQLRDALWFLERSGEFSNDATDANEIHPMGMEGQETFHVLLVLWSPRDSFVDHQIFWSCDWHLDLSDQEAIGSGDRFELEWQPRQRHIDVDPAWRVAEKQNLIGLSECVRVVDSRSEFVLLENAEQALQMTSLCADGRVHVSRRTWHATSDDCDAADEHAARRHLCERARHRRHSGSEWCFQDWL